MHSLPMVALALVTTLQGCAPGYAAGQVVTPAEWSTALASAKPGGVVRLGPGAYGDVVVQNRKFAEPVRIEAADPAAPPVFNSLMVRASEGLVFDGITVAFAPTMTTRESVNVVAIESSKRITFTDGKITSGPAVNGISETETKPDSSGNVRGWPLGRGAFIQQSQDVEISESEIWGVQRGLLSYKSANIRFIGNDIHDVRRTFILGAADDFLIKNNHLHDSKPWRWGQTPIGDHGDYIALFPATGQPSMQRVKVIGNRTSNSPDVAILGFTFVGIDDLEVRGNVLAGTDHQGMLATKVTGLKLYDNQFTGRAQVLLRDGVTGARGANNSFAGYADYSKGKGDNQIDRSKYKPPPRIGPRDTRDKSPGGEAL